MIQFSISSKKQQENETEYEAVQRQRSRCIWLTGRKGVTELEAAEAIVTEAKSVIQEELGGLGIQWKNDKEASVDEGQGQNENQDRSSVLKTPLNRSNSGNNSSINGIKTNSVNKRRNSKDSRRSLTRRKTISPKLTESSNTQDKTPNQSVVIPPDIQVHTKQNSSQNTQKRNEVGNISPSLQTNSNTSNGVNSDKNEEISNHRPCQILPNSVVMETNQVNKHLNSVKDDLHQAVKKNEKELNSTNDVEDFSQISFTIEKTQTDLKNTNNKNDKILHEGVTKKICHLNEAKNNQTEQCTKNIKSGNNLLNENDDLFAGFTQEFDVSCLAIEKLHGQNSRDSLEKLPIGDFNKQSSNQDVDKILCDTDAVSGNDHEEDNNMEGFHDEFADSFCLDTQVAMELSPHNNNSDIPLENGCKEKHQKEVIVKKKQVCEVSPSLYSEEVTDYKVVQPAIYRNPEINRQNVCKTNIKDNETSFNICLDDVLEISPVAEPPSCRIQSSTSQQNKQPPSCRIQPSTSQQNKQLLTNHLQSAVINKNEDLLNESVDLVAASNFERCLYVNSEDIFNDTGRLPQNDSYQDLHIPFQSGQERIFEDNEKQQHVSVSQYHNLHEDLAVAMEMGDSFSATILDNANKKTDLTNQKNPINELGDSLTFSMVEKVLDDRASQHLVDKCSDKTNSSGNETNVKKIQKTQNCEIDNKSNENSKKSVKGKKTKNKLSPGTLAFLDSVQSFSVPEAKEQTDKDQHLEDLETKLRHPTANSTKNKEIPISTEQKSDINEPNTSVDNDVLPPTPPIHNTSCSSPLLTLKRATPNKLKLTPRRDKAGNKSSWSNLLDNINGTAKKLKIDNINSDFERIKHQISQLESDEDDAMSSHDEEDQDYTERTFDFDPDNSSISGTQSSFTVIDVCADSRLFDTFRKEWQTKTKYAVSLACEKKKLEVPPNGGIGGKFLRGKDQGLLFQ